MLRAFAILATYIHSAAFAVAIMAGFMSFGILALRLVGVS